MRATKHVLITPKQHQYAMYKRAELKIKSFTALFQYYIDVEREKNE